MLSAAVAYMKYLKKVTGDDIGASLVRNTSVSMT
jgi:hypothetical protein